MGDVVGRKREGRGVVKGVRGKRPRGKGVHEKLVGKSGDKVVEGVKKFRKALVTGACGFSGSHMVDLLVSDGYDVIATDKADAPRRWLNPEVKFIPSDLLDKKSLEEAVNSAEVIFHPAAVFNYSAPLEVLIRANVEGTKNLLDVASARGVKKIIVWSTAGVYDVSKSEGIPIDEKGPIGPSNNYEYSKLKQEEVAIEYNESKKIGVTIIRPAPIYGPRNFYGFANIIFGINALPNFIIMPKIANKSVSVHVEDVCGAALHLALRDDTNGEIFNLVDDSDYSFSSVAILVAELLGKRVYQLPVNANTNVLSALALRLARVSRILKNIFPLIFQIPYIEGLKYLEEDTARYMAHSFRFSNKKLKNYGYKLKYPDLKDGLPGTIEWYREYGYLNGMV